ncbi:MAG: hypothetical protein ACQEWG_08450 [Bacteroidota bacterium]
MKILTLFLFLVFSQQIAAQQVLEISETGSDKSILFEQNKRVKIKTITGEKYIGRFQISDANTIEIKGNNIPLNSIENIKSRSVVAGIVGTVLIISGAYFLVISPIVALAISSGAGIAFVFGGVAMISSGIFFNEFAKNHRNTKWSYKIIDP